MQVEQLQAYEVVEKREMADLASVGYIMRHKKTGAKIALISNEDDNKVFYIGFRTPPKDSTGVAHILEHSVLCGSKDFPVKDPFVELVKGSLNTFLNAMTYPDKTVYPVASVNDTDFQNLMHVYLDAVFYPNIYANPSIFRQEGWHYELDEESGELSLNGVVYNEMKGAFSSPDDVLAREIMASLYPDTTYGFESGGDPKNIPDLTYEAFLDFHRRYYHPANSYIYLYGDMDMAEKLTFIDEQYLSKFDALTIDSHIDVQKPFAEPVKVVREYPVDEGENEEESAYLSVNYSIEDTLDKELYIAFQVLDFVLGSAPGAPIKQALTDKGIGKEIYSNYDNGIMQPYFSIVSKDTSVERKQEFLDTIQEVLQKVVKEGFDKKAILAAINYFEFKYREADFGSYPKGLMYGLQMLDSWLYDDNKPFLHIEANDTFRILKEKTQTDYYEKLVEKYLLQNPHKSEVVLVPKCGMVEQMDLEQKEKMANIKASLSDGQIAEIKETYEKLNAFQEREDSPEDLARIPLLKREDLGRKAPKILNEELKVQDRLLLYHDIFTNGISYLRLVFDLDQIPEEYYPYLGILKVCLGDLNTEHYSYGELFNESNLVTGGITTAIGVCSQNDNPDRFFAGMEIKVKVLDQNLPKAFELMEEILFTSKLDDTKRLLEILRENKSRTQASMLSGGHSVAMSRALSYGNKPAAAMEYFYGVGYYRTLSDLEEHFEEKKEDLVCKLQTLSKMLFRLENTSVDFTGDRKQIAVIEDCMKTFVKKLHTEPVKKEHFDVIPVKKNEGFMSSSQVQYVCRAGNYRKKGLPYTGSLKALKVLMGYDYLWVNVRVKGGAYGCMCGFNGTGESYFVSYRDPNLDKTIEVFEKAAEYVKNFEADERTMTQYIIGAVSDLDVPMTPYAKGSFARSMYLSHVTEAMLQKDRDELLATTPADIRNLGKYIDAFMEDDCLCATGNSGKLKENNQLFQNLENLF